MDKSANFLLIYICFLTSYFYVTCISVDFSAKIRAGQCKEHQFQCSNGICIPDVWACDKDNDCGDNSDEEPGFCDNRTTCFSENEFHCNSSHQCIPKRWVCDGESDCGDGFDEIGCEAKSCTTDEFQCNGNTTLCIPKSWFCDGQPDCIDGSDEECNYTASCQDDEWKCANGKKCIFKRWQCDGDDDCGDNSDEKNCPAPHCDSNSLSCPDEQGRERCIPIQWKCDGDIDCFNGEDERNCSHHNATAARTCNPKNDWTCGNGLCVHKSWVCDGEPDCMDLSDELPEACAAVNKTYANCSNDEFECKTSLTCVPLSARCNGSTECLDRTDEENCPQALSNMQPLCTPNNSSLFICGNDTLTNVSQCVPFDKVCNGVKDCADGSDELHCAKESCTPFVCPSGEICRDVKSKNGKKHFCDCGFGYRRGPDNRCTDINECEEFRGICTQLCVNTPGSYRCHCHNDYILQHDKKTCRAVGEHPLLLLSNRAMIHKIDLIKGTYFPLVNNLKSAVAMDYWFEKKMLIWSDVAKEKILKCELRSFGEVNESVSACEEPLVVDHVSTPDGLAVDWVHGLLFWTDTGLDEISVLNIHNRFRKALFRDDFDEPRAIAVDPNLGLLFWTDWGQNPKIEVAGMDGTGRKPIIEDGILWPNGLSVDLLEQRIYWADAKARTICSSDYHGKNRVTVYANFHKVKHPFSVAVFEERVYWTDWDQEAVLSVNKFNGQDSKQHVTKLNHGPMTIRVVQQVNQPLYFNVCKDAPCHHLCLPSPRFLNQDSNDHALYMCHCDDNFDKLSDQLCKVKVSAAIVEKQSGLLALTVIALLSSLAIIVSVIGWLFLRRMSHSPNGPFNFDNPVYRKTTEAADQPEMDPEPLDLEATQYNPVVGLFTPGHLSFNSLTEPLNRSFSVEDA